MIGRQVIGGDVVPLSAVADTSHWHLDAEPRSAMLARELVSAAIRPVSADVEATVLLLVSELVTNAILHARTPFVLGITRTSDLILITVADCDPTVPLPRDPPSAIESGRGMHLVQQLASAHGAIAGTEGKTVWATVAR